jgi:phospholipase C
MSEEQTATVNITNHTGGMALIYLFHEITDEVLDHGRWVAATGETVGSLTVHYDTGAGSHLYDWWSVLVNVLDGPNAGFYVNVGGKYPPWIEYGLGHHNNNQTLTFAVSTSEFTIKLADGTETNGMKKIAPRTRISHVFVLMLENRSFDHMFAMSGIQGISAATLGNYNEYKNNQYLVQKGAPLSLPTDPGHEFHDTVEQLCGEGKQSDWKPGGPFPAINNSGFVANYATTKDELTGLPPQAAWGDVMRCFDTPTQLPVLQQLATEFAICDQWYSSLPGLTWPNRFFVHGASSSGMDKNPSNSQIKWWEVPGYGFQYQNGSIYDSLNRAGVPYRFYNDSGEHDLSIYSDHREKGSVFGAIPQVTSLKGVVLTTPNSLEHFASDLQGPYPVMYTFIEPHYGDVMNNTYEGGSSQHPMDDVYGGEHLLAAVYEAIRQSPYWESSVLIITYDEHGGLYDHLPPPAAVPPGDSNPPVNYNVNGFLFDRLGVRVPAVVVSPLIPKNSVDHTVYDHSSLPKTVETLFGLEPLTHRDEAAQDVVHLLSLPEPRTDCPSKLNNAAPMSTPARPTLSAEQQAAIAALPMPDEGNLAGALANLVKADVDLSGGTPEEIAAIKAKFESITTRGQAHAYALEVMEKVNRIKEERRLAMRSGPDLRASAPAGS